MENTDALFRLLININKTEEGDPRHKATLAFYDNLEETIDGFSSINKNTEFRSVDYYINDTAIYTPAFKKYMYSAIDLFLSANSDNAKYVSVGRLFSSFKCRRNNFSDRLKTHILNMYRIKHYNKKIMIKKLDHLLENVKKLIGNCDTSLEKYMIKSPTRHFTRSVSRFSSAVQSVRHAMDNFLFDDVSKLTKADIESIDTARDTAVNLARQETVVLYNMRSQNIVSTKELEIEKKSNATFWLINPLVLTSLTTMNSIALTMSGSASVISKTEGITHMSEALNIAAAGLASAALLPIAPAAAFITAFVASKLSRLEIVQHLTNNKRIRDEFHAAIKNIHQHAENCSYSKDKSDYIRRHTETGVIITEYNQICKEKYDPILKLCDYFTDTYELICTEPVEYLSDKTEKSEKSRTIRRALSFELDTEKLPSLELGARQRSAPIQGTTRQTRSHRTKPISQTPRSK